MTKRLDAALLRASMYCPPPSDFEAAFEGLSEQERALLLRLAAGVIGHEAEVLGYRIDRDRSAPVNEASRWKTGQAAARLVATASAMLDDELVRQGCRWEYDDEPG